MSLYSFRKSQVDAAAAGEAVTPDATPASEPDPSAAQPAVDPRLAAAESMAAEAAANSADQPEATASAAPAPAPGAPAPAAPPPAAPAPAAPAPAAPAPVATAQASASATSAKAKIGRVRHLEAAEAFGASPEEFHAWVAANLDLVGEPTGVTWTDMTTDRRADGSGWPLVAAGPSGLGVFEAEAGESTADCLGRLITSMVEVGATSAVWLAGDPRPEHASVVAWLNASGADIQVYLVKVGAIRIDDSVPAPMLTTVVRPGRTSDETIPARPAPEPEPEPAPVDEARLSRMLATPPVASAPAVGDDGSSEPALAPAPTEAAQAQADAEVAEADTSTLLADTGRRSTDWTRRALGLRSDDES